MSELISVGSYKLDDSGEPSSTIITSNNWSAMIDKAGLRGQWLELVLIPINQLGGDWSLLEATQESLREHSQMIRDRDEQIATLTQQLAEAREREKVAGALQAAANECRSPMLAAIHALCGGQAKADLRDAYDALMEASEEAARLESDTQGEE